MRERWLFYLYQAAVLATFVFLSFFDDYRYTWWNWIFAIGMNAFLAAIWPIYWIILRPLAG